MTVEVYMRSAREKRVGFNARLTQEVDDWLEAQAQANVRSKNAEIEYRLKAAMAADSSSRSGGVPTTEGALQG